MKIVMRDVASNGEKNFLPRRFSGPSYELLRPNRTQQYQTYSDTPHVRDGARPEVRPVWMELRQQLRDGVPAAGSGAWLDRIRVGRLAGGASGSDAVPQAG